MIDAAHIVVSRSIGNSGSRRRRPNAPLHTSLPRSITAICAPVTCASANVFRANVSASEIGIVVPSNRRIDATFFGEAAEHVLTGLHMKANTATTSQILTRTSRRSVFSLQRSSKSRWSSDRLPAPFAQPPSSPLPATLCSRQRLPPKPQFAASMSVDSFSSSLFLQPHRDLENSTWHSPTAASRRTEYTPRTTNITHRCQRQVSVKMDIEAFCTPNGSKSHPQLRDHRAH